MTKEQYTLHVPIKFQNALELLLGHLYFRYYFSGFWFLPLFSVASISCFLTSFIMDSDRVFVRWWENYISHSCHWVCWGSVFANAYSEWLHQESIVEFFFINQVYRNHCNSIGSSCSALAFTLLTYDVHTCLHSSMDLYTGYTLEFACRNTFVFRKMYLFLSIPAWLHRFLVMS